jgi:hypothetical protein
MRSLPAAGLLLASAVVLSARSPVVSAGGVVDAASFAAPVAPGSLVSIFGSNLAPQTGQAAAIPLPISLAGVSVSFNGLSAPLLYVAPGQINAQLPFGVSSYSSVNKVVNNNGIVSTPQTIDVSPYAPVVFALQGYAVAINSDGTLAAPAGSIAQIASHPAVPGGFGHRSRSRESAGHHWKQFAGSAPEHGGDTHRPDRRLFGASHVFGSFTAIRRSLSAQRRRPNECFAWRFRDAASPNRRGCRCREHDHRN